MWPYFLPAMFLSLSLFEAVQASYGDDFVGCEAYMAGIEAYRDATEAHSCLERYCVTLRECKTYQSHAVIDYCENSPESGSKSLCLADECLKERGYSGGINTNPSLLCNSNTHAFQSQSDEEEVVVEKPSSPPIPRPRPPRPATQDDSTGGEESITANWREESSQDIQQCSSLQSQANTCCNQPMSCSSELTQSQQQSLLDVARAAQARGDHAGIAEICRQSRVVGVSSGNLNTGFANICYGKHSSCTQTCSQALSKWQQRLNNCGAGCDRPLVDQTVNALQSKQRQCQSYASLESQIRRQAFASSEDVALAQICKRNSGSLASAEGGALAGAANTAGAASMSFLAGQSLNEELSDSGSSHSGQMVCATNPNAPGCYAPGYENEDPAGLSDTGGGSATPNDFNVGTDNNFYSNDVGADNPSSESFSPQQVEGHRVPHEGGEGLPGQASDGGAMAMASKDPAAGADLPAMLGSGVNPNILGEVQSGNGYSAPVGSNAGSGFEFRSRSGGANGGARVRRSGKNYVGMDLKKYLPGGASDPRRQMAGLSEFHPDIGPKHVDFFQRVSTRLRTICKFKRLLDCH